MKTIRQQEHARKAEYRREYQREWQKRFKEEHGMSYRDALALKKAVNLLNTVTERTQADD